MLFAMYDLPEIIWNFAMIYGLYVIYKRIRDAGKKALQNDAVKKAASTQAMNLIQCWLK